MLNRQGNENHHSSGFESGRPSASKATALKNLSKKEVMTTFNQLFVGIEGLKLVDELLAYFNFSFIVSEQEKARIPERGRVVIISNHPIGSLDALALLKMVGEVRPDVKILGDHGLRSIEALRSLALPNTNDISEVKLQMDEACKHLNLEGVLIVFPAGESTQFGARSIKDGRWASGFLTIAEQSNAPVLPVYIDAESSLLFYTLSIFSRPLATRLSLSETFKQTQSSVKIRVGGLIDPLVYQDLSLPFKTKIKLFRKQLYRIGKNKPSLFRTLVPIAPAEDRQQLIQEVANCNPLGETRDSKKIFLYQYHEGSSLIREIGRLREQAFRLIGEGTGNQRDIDDYDKYYMHIVLWDEGEKEVVGAYRLCATHNNDLYTQSLFEYNQTTDAIIKSGLELGRSFVQPKYWGSRSLEYLWYGIAGFLKQNPQYRYLLGAVSISNTFSRPAKDLIVGYYQQYYAAGDGADKLTVTSKRPYVMDESARQRIRVLFEGKNAREAFVVLKAQLRHLGYSVPALYKQYAELTNPGGSRFLGFNIDPDFNDCVDGLVVVDINEISAAKRKRYGLMDHMAEDSSSAG